MIIKINENISICQIFNAIELSFEQSGVIPFDSMKMPAWHCFEKQRISIQDRWFDIIHPSELFRKRNKSDGYYRVIYIQINMDSGEYYIGKANRPRWAEILRYQGSGLRFKNNYKINKSEFVRYFIAVCETSEETEKLEALIVNKALLSDEKCLNLVVGGGGTSNNSSLVETNLKKREYMRDHPERFLPMLLASKKAFQSGQTPKLLARNKSIKETMSEGKYRKMSLERFARWKDESPLEYEEARKKNREKIKTPEVQAKRQTSLKGWVEQNTEAYQVWQEKLVNARNSDEAKQKRKESLNEWRKKNPLKAKLNSHKRAKAAAAKTGKPICMIDLETEKILRNFPSAHAAARWLVQEGKAKNINCVSSINSVCLHRSRPMRSGLRKKAYGYNWSFKEDF